MSHPTSFSSPSTDVSDLLAGLLDFFWLMNATVLLLKFPFLPSSLKSYLPSNGRSVAELSPEKSCIRIVHFQSLLVWLLQTGSTEEKGSSLALEAQHQVAYTIPRRSSVRREMRDAANSPMKPRSNLTGTQEAALY